MKLITQDEAAKLMRKSKTTVARLRANGEIPFIPGRPVRFHLKDVEAYLNAQTIRKPKRKTKAQKKAQQKSKIHQRAALRTLMM